MERLNSIDQTLSAAINGWNSPAADAVMVFASRVYVWVPLYIAIIIWYFCRLPWRKALAIVVTLILAFVFTDKFSHFLKESVFMRFRPCEDPVFSSSIRLLEKHGSLYGFPSGHACNTFCFALLTSLTARRRWWTPLIFFWAALVSYSRIYVGKHYLGDVLGGIVLGIAAALLIYLILRTVLKQIDKCSA